MQDVSVLSKRLSKLDNIKQYSKKTLLHKNTEKWANLELVKKYMFTLWLEGMSITYYIW